MRNSAPLNVTVLCIKSYLIRAAWRLFTSDKWCCDFCRIRRILNQTQIISSF